MKNFLIIGGSNGIGLELTKILSKENNVYATYNSNETEIENVTFQRFNALTDTFDTSFLPDEIHGLAYLPGSIQLKPFNRFKSEDFIQDYHLQVIGAVSVIQSVLPKLKASGKASIVLFSTVAVNTGFNFHSLVASSKGAIQGLTKALAAEFAPTIRVNAIAPSITNTPLASNLLNSEEKIAANAQRHPMKAIGEPKDIAEMASFLLSDSSKWMTGQIISVDGGMSAIKG